MESRRAEGGHGELALCLTSPASWGEYKTSELSGTAWLSEALRCLGCGVRREVGYRCARETERSGRMFSLS